MPQAIALTLKKRYGIKDFSGMVIGREYYAFLKQQKDVKFNPLVLMQDVFIKSQDLKIDYGYLRSLEKKYGVPTLWMYLCADKDLLVHNRYTFYTHEELMKIIQSYFKSITELLEKVKPDFIVMPLVENMGLLVLHEVARSMNIPTLMFTTTRVGDQTTIFRDTYEGFEKIFPIYEKLQKGSYRSKHKADAIKFLKKFRAKETVYADYLRAYKGQQEFFESIWKSPVKSLTRTMRYFNKYYFGPFKNDYMYKNKSPIKLALAEMEVRVRRATLKRSRIFEKPNYKEQYAYYPLQFEPEVTLTLLAPFYIDQVALIENIARSLPIDFKLYVKEHPTMVGFRPMSYYQRLLRTPNVRLIDPSTSSYQLIKNARLVTTITGTVGLEALLLKKPVITFGRIFYNKLEMVRKAEDPASLPGRIRDTLENYKHDDRQLVNFITAVFEGAFYARWSEVADQGSLEKVLSHPDFNAMMDALVEEMGLKSPAA